jgi:hypothetical protein
VWKPPGLDGDAQGCKCFGFGQELPSAGRQGNKLFSSAARAEVLSDFLEAPTETLGGVKSTEAQRRVIALFDPAMIFLDAAVQISIAAMVNLGTSLSQIAHGQESARRWSPG